MPMTDAALLFPGQGSQELNMSRGLAEKDAALMDLWKKAERASGVRLREIYWAAPDAALPPESDDTRVLQPALTAANLVFWAAMAGRVRPLSAAGHSLGEYSALAAAGALGLDEVLRLVSLRGRLMAEADREGRGAMAAILKLDLEHAQKAVRAAAEQSGEALIIANYNTPRQFVASGHKKAVDALTETVRELKGRAVTLAVSGAFHSPYMAEAAGEFRRALDKADWSTPRFPVYCNASGKSAADAAAVKKQAEKQMTSSVMWIDTVSGQYAAGTRNFVECGPKAVLTKMIGQILSPLSQEADYTALSAEKFMQGETT